MTKDFPLVSVIAVCYNHERFVEQTLQSVLNQTYSNIEIIVVDDASTDNSVKEIKKFINKFPKTQFIKQHENIGNCKAFNKGLALAKGEYIIDLATDDILLKDRVEKGVKALVKCGQEYGVNFTNATIIDEQSIIHQHFYPIDQSGKAKISVSEGEIYSKLVARYFICPPTMMTRREVFEKLNGYDESLAYEDFDFWVRSSRYFKYCFTDEVLVQRRVVSGSLSSKQYVRNSLQMRSTFKVCKKIKKLNKTANENTALRKRIYFEMRQCLRLGDFKLFFNYTGFLLGKN
jgi:glycosyltransferase involved in cell wall biosynthesis